MPASVSRGDPAVFYPHLRITAVHAASVALVLAIAFSGCRSTPPAPTPLQTAWDIYRFDDHFDSAATVSGPQSAPSLRLAEPIVWEFKEKVITWNAARGRIGFKRDQLIVKGENATPVIVSPASPPIDWSRYEAIRIRMVAEAGSEIKIKVGDLELRQPLAPPMEWQVYRFDLKLSESTFTVPLAVMPTDDLNAAVAIDSIELVPKKSRFTNPAGRAYIGKREEYRNTIFTRVPSSITFETRIPKDGILRAGLGISGKQPVAFRILAGPSDTELLSKTIADPDLWDDISVDLSAYAGTTQKLVFRTEANGQDAVGLWANPLVTSRTPKSRANVLLYVVCTMRPDHMSLYGYGRETTPFLKTLGASSVVFDDAVAQAPWTKPSVASMLTSLHAYAHGLVNETDTIPKNATTLAEQLRRAGYVTAGIVANPFAGRTSGLERGFDYMMEYPVVQRNRTDAVDRGTDSAAINRVIVPWLERHREEPFFLFVLSTDPHAPYRPPADTEAKFANPAETPAFNNEYARLRDIRAYGGGASVSQAEMRAKGVDPETYKKRAIDRYDAEIAHNDSSLEQLIGHLKQTGDLDNTIVIVASDHGEEFWEHGFGAHGHSLYRELIRAALLIRHPRLMPTPRRVAEPVQLIDIMPTVLELTGVEAPQTLHGESLVPLLKGEPFTRHRTVMSSKLALPRARPGSGVPENLTDSFARIDPFWKLIYRTQAGRAGLPETELYERRSDPADRNNVASRQGDLAAKLKFEVVQWIEAQKDVRKQLGPGGQTTLDPQALERLRSLGYVGGKK